MKLDEIAAQQISALAFAIRRKRQTADGSLTMRFSAVKFIENANVR
jgi:hypothetical protein